MLAINKTGSLEKDPVLVKHGERKEQTMGLEQSAVIPAWAEFIQRTAFVWRQFPSFSRWLLKGKNRKEPLKNHPKKSEIHCKNRCL